MTMTILLESSFVFLFHGCCCCNCFQQITISWVRDFVVSIESSFLLLVVVVVVAVVVGSTTGTLESLGVSSGLWINILE